jgi:hypothetical protein
MLPLSVLMQTRFVRNWGCLQYSYVRSLPEHLAFAAMLFGVAVLQMPTSSRVIGARPSVKTCLGATMTPSR